MMKLGQVDRVKVNGTVYHVRSTWGDYRARSEKLEVLRKRVEDEDEGANGEIDGLMDRMLKESVLGFENAADLALAYDPETMLGQMSGADAKKIIGWLLTLDGEAQGVEVLEKPAGALDEAAEEGSEDA